jgi:predicted neuraminidase
VSNQQILNLSELVRRGELFRPPGDPDRVEAFIPTPVSENHASNLVELSNADLLCTWFAGTEEGNRDIKILLSRLPAGGGAWAEPILLSDDYNRSEQNPMLFAAPDGRVYLFWTAQETRGGLRSDWNARKARGVMGREVHPLHSGHRGLSS